MKKSVKITVASIVGVAIICAGGFAAWKILDNQSFRLDDESYAKSEAIDINKDEYDEFIKENKSL